MDADEIRTRLGGPLPAAGSDPAEVIDLLGLPAGSDVGFVTGATMANVTGLAAGRTRVLDRIGWDLQATSAEDVRLCIDALRRAAG